MLTASATVATERPSRYLTQLCKHFARKVHSEWSDERGYTDFGWGTCVMVAAPGTLSFEIAAPTAEGLGRVEHVVTNHLERFGARDSLSLTWSRAAAPSPSIMQKSSDE